MWKTAQTILFLVALGAALLLGWDAWKHRQLAAEVAAQAAELVARQDSLKNEARRLQNEADSTALVLDSLEAMRAQEKAAATRRAAALRERADSLEETIGELMPPNVVAIEIREAVMDAVREIRMADDERIADLTNLLASTELSLERSQEVSARKDRIIENWGRAFAAMETERDLWKGTAQPSFFGRLKRDAPGWAISAGITIIGWEIAR